MAEIVVPLGSFSVPQTAFLVPLTVISVPLELIPSVSRAWNARCTPVERALHARETRVARP